MVANQQQSDNGEVEEKVDHLVRPFVVPPL